MLGLKLPTDPRWVDLASLSLAEILTDHAYCEQKAASTCISLIQQYADRPELVSALAPIVTEEWGHFRLVWEQLQARGFEMGPQRQDEYVHELQSFRLKGAGRDAVLMDKLLMAGLIEARSCERFRLLSEGLTEPGLRQFYRQFMISEAGHYRLFLDLARRYGGAAAVQTRWKEWLAFEKEVIEGLQVRGDRMH